MTINAKIYAQSGIQQLKSMIAGNFPPPSMGLTMNMRLADVDYGFARFEVKATENHLNPMGGVHGGFAATVLDSATGCAVHSVLEPGEGYGTIDLNVKMMRPVPKNVKLVCEGRVLNRSKSLGVSEAKLVDENGKLYAHATCTCKIIAPTS
ncbi:MAG: PaaI family thioesterase [Kangiellaceae bacterium]|nr:PaaI family thioesterase [Kangiellaceae bacterium]